MKRSLFVLFLFACVPLTGQQQAIILPVQNHSFEQLNSPLSTVGPGHRQTSCGLEEGWGLTIPGWLGGLGVLQPGTSNPCLIPPPPEGNIVAIVNGGSMSQYLEVKPADLQRTSFDGLYTMTFYVANYFHNYPGYFEGALSVGTFDEAHRVLNIEQELCSTDGWASKGFTQITLVCPVPGYLIFDQIIPPAFPKGLPADPNAHLIISLSNTQGWPVLFDDVSLTFTPVNTPGNLQ